MCTVNKHVPELMYFNAKGNAEVTRQMFSIAGVELKDTRFSGLDEWKTVKAEGKIS